jgi:dTDP-glucose 4,6-dehydratase
MSIEEAGPRSREVAHCWLVTGGAGFIGTNFVRSALANDPTLRIVTLDLLTYAGCRDNLDDLDPRRHRLVVGDVADAALLEELLTSERPCAIIHMAAESHVDRSIDGPAAFLKTNVAGTFMLLEALRRYWPTLIHPDRFRMLHVSTDEVFGSLDTAGAFTEQSAYRPTSPYAASKAAADHFVRAYGQTYGLPVMVSHCTNNYGPYQFPEKLIPLVLLNALDGRELPVYGDGAHRRDWLHVEDHVRGLRAMLMHGRNGASYGFGGGCELTTLEAVHAICAELDRQYPRAHGSYTEQIAFVADRPGHDRRYAIDASLAARELGWTPAISFQTGLADTVTWYLEHLAWCRDVCTPRYARQRLGLAQSVGQGQ